MKQSLKFSSERNIFEFLIQLLVVLNAYIKTCTYIRNVRLNTSHYDLQLFVCSFYLP